MQLSRGSRVQRRPCWRHSCQNSGLLSWKTCVSNTCEPTFHNYFVLCGIFLRLQVQWTNDNTAFSVKEIRKGSVSPTRRSATPTSRTWISHGYVDRERLFQVHALVEHNFIVEYDLSSQDRARAKENAIYPPKLFVFRKKEWARESERVRASMTGESSSARFGGPCFIAERNLPSQWSSTIFYRAGVKELENAIFLPSSSSSKEILWKGFNDGRE